MTMDTPKTIVVTGASSGIGAAAARRLSAEGAKVIVVGRDEARTDEIAGALGAERLLADYSRLSDVHALAAELNKLDRIDVLANNAGGIFAERTITDDGYERTLQVNHLAPFLLTRLLLPKLIESRASVINTSSMAQAAGRLNLADLQLDRGWTSWNAYANAKLANVLFTRGLHHRYVLEGVSTAAFHPGMVATSFGADTGGPAARFYASGLGKAIMKSPEQGADTLVWLAQGAPPRDWPSGEYFVGRRVRRANKQASDAHLVEAFWDRSAMLVDD